MTVANVEVRAGYVHRQGEGATARQFLQGEVATMQWRGRARAKTAGRGRRCDAHLSEEGRERQLDFTGLEERHAAVEIEIELVSPRTRYEISQRVAVAGRGGIDAKGRAEAD